MAKGKNRLSAEERRQQIIVKASEIFAGQGLDGARTRDLAKACGINESLLYKHFPSKEHLYKEAMAYLHDQMVDTWRAIPQEPRNNADSVKHAIEKACAFFSQNPQLAANMLHGVAVTTHAPEMASQARDWFASYHKYLRSLIMEGIEDGSIMADIDIEAASITLMGVAWVCAITEVIQFDEIRSQMNPERIVAFILREPERKALNEDS
jgi:AcrR family transcriptional regulator